MTVPKLRKLEDLVLPIMERCPKARNDDYYLYAEVIRILCPEVEEKGFFDVLLNHNEYGIPPFESVGRTRRRIQEKHPELASERTKAKRAEQEKVYREYARTS